MNQIGVSSLCPIGGIARSARPLQHVILFQKRKNGNACANAWASQAQTGTLAAVAPRKKEWYGSVPYHSRKKAHPSIKRRLPE